MKSKLASKLAQYLTNIYEMRLLIRNCFKYTQQCQNGIYEKSMSSKNSTLISIVYIPYMYTSWYVWESPNIITEAPFHTLGLKIGI